MYDQLPSSKISELMNSGAFLMIYHQECEIPELEHPS